MKGKIFRGLAVAALAAAFAVSASAGTATTQNDSSIQAAVAHKLAGKSQLRGVQANVEDGVVTLTGSVSSYADKIEAAKKAKVDHVAGIRNLVEVSAAPVSDADLQAKLAKSLAYDDPYFDNVFNVVAVGVQNGAVTVSGEVRTPTDKDAALALVEHTKGVRDVIDQVKVAPLSMFDDELRIRLARAIYGAPALGMYGMDPAAPIRILVDNGHVTLAGVVNSEVDKSMAYMRASAMSGVFSVTNDLQVAGRKTS